MSNDGEYVRRLFDEEAASWSERYERGRPLSGRPTRFLNALLTLKQPPATILDLGCGTGNLARAFAMRGYEVFGADVAKAMLKRAHELSPKGKISWIPLRVGWTKLPFKESQFDVIVASSVFEYLDDSEMTLQECCRTLRTGGVVLCTVPNPHHPIRYAEALAAFCLDKLNQETFSRYPARLRRYFDYVRASRNRYPLARWESFAAQAHMHTVPVPDSGRGMLTPLVLLAFRKTC